MGKCYRESKTGVTLARAFDQLINLCKFKIITKLMLRIMVMHKVSEVGLQYQAFALVVSYHC
jgi:hypothetical protein